MKLFSFLIAALVGLAAAVAVAVPAVELASRDEPSNSTDPLICGVLVGKDGVSRQDMIVDIGRRQCRKVNIDANWLHLGVPVDCYFYNQDGCGADSFVASAHGPNRFFLGKKQFVHTGDFGRPWYQCEKAGQNSENEIITGLALKAARAVETGVEVGKLYPRDDSAVQSLFLPTEENEGFCKDITIVAYMVDIKAGIVCSFHQKSCSDRPDQLIYGPSHKQNQLVDGLKFYACYVFEGVPPPDLSADLAVRDTESEPHDAAYLGKLYERDATVMQSLFLGNEVEGACRNISIEAYRLDIEAGYTCSFYRACHTRPDHLIDGPIHKTILVDGLKFYLCDLTNEIPPPQDPTTASLSADPANAAYVGELRGKGTDVQSLFLSSEIEDACRNITIKANRAKVEEGFTCSFYRKSCNPHHKALDIKGPSYETHIQSDFDWYICNITDDKQASLPPRSLPTVDLSADVAVRDTTESKDKIDRGQWNSMTKEQKDVAVASLAAEQCKPEDASTRFDHPPDVTCGTVQSWASIPPFRLTTFPQCSDCNMISYGGIAYNVTKGCTCSFYEMCGGDTLIKVVGPKAGPIPHAWSRAYTCTFDAGLEGPQGPILCQ